MSVVLDDRAEDIVVTKNGKFLKVVTDYVPFPMGRDMYETGVFPCSKQGIVNYKSEVDFALTRDKAEADQNHADMVNKWMKATL